MIEVRVGDKLGLKLHEAKFATWTEAGIWIDGLLATDKEAVKVYVQQINSGPNISLTPSVFNSAKMGFLS